MRNLYYIIFLFAGLITTVKAQELTLMKGMVNQQLKVNDSTEETFSLYVPADFNAENRYKILFIIDPQGMGARVTRLFSTDVPGRDFVIAANEWKLSDDLDKNMSKFFAMLKTVTGTIRLQKNQIYAAGLNEGAQVASALPYVVDGFSGLLIINDVFVKYRQRRVDIEEIYFGMIGNASDNYYSVNDSFEYLQDLNSDNILLEYEGSDEWPIGNYLSSAFSSLYFKVNDKNKEKLNDSLITRTFKSDSLTAEMLMRKRQFLVAYDYIDHLKDKYRGKMKLRPLRKQIRSLRSSTGYRSARRQQSRNTDEELALRSDLAYFLEEDVAMANFDNLAYWDQRILELDSAMVNENKPQEQRVARRIKGMLENSLESFDQVYESEAFNINQALFFNILKTIFDKDNYEAYKEVITLAAKDRDYDTANFYLEKMLKQGYDDYESLYNIPDTEVLHISEGFNKVVREYFDKSKF